MMIAAAPKAINSSPAQKSFFWNNPDIIEIPPTDAAKIKYVLMNVNGKGPESQTERHETEQGRNKIRIKTQGAANEQHLQPLVFLGAPSRIRTCGPQIRSLMLYPAELWALL